MSASYLHALSPTGRLIPLICDEDGRLYIEGQIALDSLPAGTNFIGKTGYSLKRVSTSFNRPGDTTTYSIGDSISNSTSAPTVFELDLSTIGAVAGQSIAIQELAICSSIKQSLLPLINCYLSPVTFAATNDNAPFDITDVINEGGGHYLNCDLQNSSVSNSRCSYIGVSRQMILAAADTKLYGALQMANAYVPGSAEKFTILAWITLL